MRKEMREHAFRGRRGRQCCQGLTKVEGVNQGRLRAWILPMVFGAKSPMETPSRVPERGRQTIASGASLRAEATNLEPAQRATLR
jgi:hypothetical protein